MKQLIKYLIAIVATTALTALCASAHKPDKYAAASKLAEGKWVKLEVEATGMQFISNSELSGMGLNPAATNVYGYGGRQIPDALTIGEPDDLPLVPNFKVGGGIMFFGTDNIRWEANGNSGSMNYSHLMHPYSTKSVYFLSDRTPGPSESLEVATSSAYTYNQAAPVASTYWARQLHESELTAPSITGRILLGEDFRTSPNQTYSFPTPGAAGKARLRIRFGAAITGGSATLTVKANGQTLPKSGGDVIGAMTGDNQFLQVSATVKEFAHSAGSLTVDLSCALGGMVSAAALDYIELEYERSLALGEGWLHFHDVLDSQKTFKIEGCTSQTQIWDITDLSRPVKVNHTLKGSVALFTDRTRGLREYLAFNPVASGCNVVKAGTTVANQNIHAMPNPDMVIITPLRYSNQANDLADLHRRRDGMTVHVLTPDHIYNEFSSGSPDVGAFRKMLKMWADRHAADPALPSPDYCLLMGRATHDNKLLTKEGKALPYPIIPIWQSAGYYSEPSSYSTDDYIGMTDDSDNGFDIGTQKIRTAVGRLPVRSEEEASMIVEKIKQYIERPNYGPWRNQVMIIADDQDGNQHLAQGEEVYRGMYENGNGANFVYEKLYLDSYPMVATATGDTYPGAKARMLQKWNEGVSWIEYIGHAHPRGWGHEQLLTWTEINNFSNENLPFLLAATCSFAKHDAPTQSGAEILLFNPEGGIIGTICPSRTVYIAQNGTLTGLTAKETFARTADGKPRKVGEVMLHGKNKYPGSDQNKLRFSLLCDPAIPVLSPENKIVVESIGGINPEEVRPDQAPVLEALGQTIVKGHIEDPTGKRLEDFNGNLHLTLYDAERVVTTFGQGVKGTSTDYNDRKTKLFSGATKVVSGEWQIKVLMPAEIENNWSPAQFTAYAYSADGREANGSCERVYVYGVDENAPDDQYGPDILSFTLNDPGFAPGSVTHPDPLVLATICDPSGINISEAGLGHRMLLTLDGNTHFEDVAQFYNPDPEMEGGGKISYPLSGLAPGHHELKLTVWDNANNSSAATFPFCVGLNRDIDTFDFLTDANPAHDKVTFTLRTDRVKTLMKYEISIHSLNGQKVWGSKGSSRSKTDGSVRKTWYLDDSSGSRVPRGIYLCRATIESEEGVQSSKTLKLAVSAQ